MSVSRIAELRNKIYFNRKTDVINVDYTKTTSLQLMFYTWGKIETVKPNQYSNNPESDDYITHKIMVRADVMIDSKFIIVSNGIQYRIITIERNVIGRATFYKIQVRELNNPSDCA